MSFTEELQNIRKVREMEIPVIHQQYLQMPLFTKVSFESQSNSYFYKFVIIFQY